MKLNLKQITKIQRKIAINEKKNIVLIDVMGDKNLSDSEIVANIYCVDNKNNIIWRVNETKTKIPFNDDGFVYLGLNDKGETIAYRFSGFEYKIDPETGEAEQIRFHK
jgi:hypothetical protein